MTVLLFIHFIILIMTSQCIAQTNDSLSSQQIFSLEDLAEKTREDLIAIIQMQQEQISELRSEFSFNLTQTAQVESCNITQDTPTFVKIDVQQECTKSAPGNLNKTHARLHKELLAMKISSKTLNESNLMLQDQIQQLTANLNQVQSDNRLLSYFNHSLRLDIARLAQEREAFLVNATKFETENHLLRAHLRYIQSQCVENKEKLEILLVNLLQADDKIIRVQGGVDKISSLQDSVNVTNEKLITLQKGVDQIERLTDVEGRLVQVEKQMKKLEQALDMIPDKLHCLQKARTLMNVTLEFLDGGYYYFSDNEPLANWSSAREFCQSKGLDLASIESEKEYQALEASIRRLNSKNGNMFIWISGSDVTAEGFWKWKATGAPITYKKYKSSCWSDVEREDCLCILQDRWCDCPCSLERSFICEMYTPC